VHPAQAAPARVHQSARLHLIISSLVLEAAA